MRTPPLLALLLMTVVVGRLFAEPMRLARGIQPQIALGAQNEILLTWVDQGQIRFARSDDHGRSFSPSSGVAKPDGLMAGMRRGPRIADDGHMLIISACAPDLQSWASTDGGKTWQGPAHICDQPKASREGLHGLTSLPAGGFMAVWLDSREGRTEIWGSRSTDGVRWSANQCIYRAPVGSVCECCHPSVIAAGTSLQVMWRNSLDGFRDFYLASSHDGGVNFGPALKLGTGTWKLAACPMDGGSLVVSPQGQPAGVWRRGTAIFYAGDNQAETRIGDGLQPAAATGPDGLCVVWQQGGAVVCRHGQNPKIELGAGRYPVVTANSKTPPVVAWEKNNEIWLAASP